MGKKNDLLSKLGTSTTTNTKKTATTEMKNVIQDMLSNESVENVIKFKKTEYISYDKIDMYENNNLSLNNINELKAQISQMGLLEPLIVVKNNGDRYLLISGHRRLTAIKELYDESKWNSEKFVECKVLKLNELPISGSDQMKIELLNLTANEHRIMTEADQYSITIRWNNIINEYRNAGIKVITLQNNDGQFIEKNIAGERTADIVSEATSLGASKIKEITRIEKNGSEKLKNSVMEGKISIHSAAVASQLSKENQDLMLEEALTKSDKVELNQVASHQKKINNEKAKPTENLPTGYVNSSIFKEDIKSISTLLKKSAITFTETDYQKYTEAINTLKVLFRA